MLNDLRGDIRIGSGPLPSVPVLSIVTPTYNQSAFIEETIRSVLSQQGDFLLDYIIVDGGSTDTTIGILQKFEMLLAKGQWPFACRGIRFRWISEKDDGQSDAIAKGFRMAEGSILAYINSDDVYHDNAVEHAVRTFRQHPDSGVVYGMADLIDEQGAIIGQYPTEPYDRIRLAIADYICQPSAFFTRAVYDRCGGVDIGLQYVMDYDLWMRMSRCASFSYIPATLSKFRFHGESKTVATRHALENHRECIHAVLRYYSWAPLNRVVGYAYQYVRNRLPSYLASRSWCVLLGAFPVAVLLYFWYNKWPRIMDLRLITRGNLRKLAAMDRTP